MKVSNPLTIIAIFSGLAEILATVALIQLPPEIQSIFVYFVMAFPTALVLLFFFVLYFKNTVLYAPSDYEDQAHYLEVNKVVKQNISQNLDKLFASVNAKGASLSTKEIEEFKSKMEKSVDEAIPLSPRESIILELLKKGLSVAQIAEQLNLSRAAVSNYRFRMVEQGLLTKNGHGKCV